MGHDVGVADVVVFQTQVGEHALMLHAPRLVSTFSVQLY